MGGLLLFECMKLCNDSELESINCVLRPLLFIELFALVELFVALEVAVKIEEADDGTELAPFMGGKETELEPFALFAFRKLFELVCMLVEEDVLKKVEDVEELLVDTLNGTTLDVTFELL
jgi:hypothetical protein